MGRRGEMKVKRRGEFGGSISKASKLGSPVPCPEAPYCVKTQQRKQKWGGPSFHSAGESVGEGALRDPVFSF